MSESNNITTVIDLSVAETNNIRKKLGLKPLVVSSSQATEHIEKVVEISQKPLTASSTEMLAAKIAASKLAREEKAKLRSLGDDVPELSAKDWIKMTRNIPLDDNKAAPVDHLKSNVKKNMASSVDDIDGIQLRHDVSTLAEEGDVIMTLKETSILDSSGKGLNDEEDMLENAELREQNKLEEINQRKDELKSLQSSRYEVAKADPFNLNRKRGSGALVSDLEEESGPIVVRKGGVVARGSQPLRASKSELTQLAGSHALSVPEESRVVSDFMTAEEMAQMRKKKKRSRMVDSDNEESKPVQTLEKVPISSKPQVRGWEELEASEKSKIDEESHEKEIAVQNTDALHALRFADTASRAAFQDALEKASAASHALMGEHKKALVDTNIRVGSNSAYVLESSTNKSSSYYDEMSALRDSSRRKASDTLRSLLLSSGSASSTSIPDHSKLNPQRDENTFRFGLGGASASRKGLLAAGDDDDEDQSVFSRLNKRSGNRPVFASSSLTHPVDSMDALKRLEALSNVDLHSTSVNNVLEQPIIDADVKMENVLLSATLHEREEDSSIGLVYDATAQFTATIDSKLKKWRSHQVEMEESTTLVDEDNISSTLRSKNDLAVVDSIEEGQASKSVETSSDIKNEEKKTERVNFLYSEYINDDENPPPESLSITNALHIFAQTGAFNEKKELHGRAKDQRDEYMYGGGIHSAHDKDLIGSRVVLEYKDDMGRELTKKEAFRQLSAKFHGTAPTKKKLEKIRKMEAQERKNSMAAAGSVPTIKALEHAQKAGQAFITLSKNK